MRGEAAWLRVNPDLAPAFMPVSRGFDWAVFGGLLANLIR